jgi:hypothetical protein
MQVKLKSLIPTIVRDVMHIDVTWTQDSLTSDLETVLLTAATARSSH